MSPLAQLATLQTIPAGTETIHRHVKALNVGIRKNLQALFPEKTVKLFYYIRISEGFIKSGWQVCRASSLCCEVSGAGRHLRLSVHLGSALTACQARYEPRLHILRILSCCITVCQKKSFHRQLTQLEEKDFLVS